MKTIGILSYERAGTTWLTHVLNTEGVLCLYEIFSRNPAQYYWNILNLMKTTDCIPEVAIKAFEKIFHPENMRVDPLSYRKIKRKMLASNPFSIELLKTYQEEAYKRNKMLCFKIFPYHLQENIRVEDVIDLCDYIIITYRDNILETFLSWKLAIKTGEWTKKSLRRDQQDRSTPAKVSWDEVEYRAFYQDICGYINEWKRASSNSKREILMYEDIHNMGYTIDQKLRLVQKTIDSLGINMSVYNGQNIEKQADYSDLSKIIDNFADFIISKDNIPIFYHTSLERNI